MAWTSTLFGFFRAKFSTVHPCSTKKIGVRGGSWKARGRHEALQQAANQAEKVSQLSLEGDALGKELVGVIGPDFFGLPSAGKGSGLLLLSHAPKQLGVQPGQNAEDVVI